MAPAFRKTARYDLASLESAVLPEQREPIHAPQLTGRCPSAILRGHLPKQFWCFVVGKVFINCRRGFHWQQGLVSGANIGWVNLRPRMQAKKHQLEHTSNGYRGDTDLRSPMSDGNWHLVTITVDRTANKLVSYIDSNIVSVDGLANAGTASLNAGFNTLVGSSGLGLWAATADVDDLAIWGRSLTSAEVDNIYTKGNLGPDHLDDYTMPPATNAFGNKHVLIIRIDGCRQDALLAANATNIYALIANGTVTYNAFTGGQLGGATQQTTQVVRMDQRRDRRLGK